MNFTNIGNHTLTSVLSILFYILGTAFLDKFNEVPVFASDMLGKQIDGREIGKDCFISKFEKIQCNKNEVIVKVKFNTGLEGLIRLEYIRVKDKWHLFKIEPIELN